MASRRAKDGLYSWKPYPKQARFIDAVLKGETQEAWFIAANRAGKSDAGAYIGSVLARFGPQDHNPNFSSLEGPETFIRTRPTSGWVIALDFPTSRDVIQPKYFDNGYLDPNDHSPFIPEHEIESWSVQNQILKLKNGSSIGFKSADSRRKKFQGAGKDWVQPDEEPPQPVYQEATIRVAANRRLRVFGTCTMLPPEGEQGGISWLWPDKIKPFLDNSEDAVAQIFGASIYDNPHLDPRELKRLEALYPEGSIERRIRLDGEWLPGMAGSRAYPSFDRSLNVSAQRDYYNPYKPLAWCWDFNVDPMVCIIGQRDGFVFRIFDEMTKEDGDIPGMCDRFYHTWGNKHRGEFHIFGDATGKGRHASGTGPGRSSYFWIRSSCQPIAGRIKLRVPDSNPHVVDRINSVNYNCRNENDERLVMIDPRCNELIADFEQVLRDSTGGIKKSTRSRDPYARRTHYSDAAGYWIALESPVIAKEPSKVSMPQRHSFYRAIASPHYSNASA